MPKFTITFLPAGRKLALDRPESGFPEAGHHEGRPGSILDLADQNDIAIPHACGGFAACTTCHVIVRQGGASCPPAEETEEDMLDQAPGLTPHSRLACQCVPDGSQDLVVEIPAVNRNVITEGH
ncbi:MAG: 2Fe-2S iron-sulfur cluster-binding protein [Deltaproteobacteria bacterium]|nr:2Fe-2S iron-sulfur cluster-binding protein [Deltaproteobacteria bacterium]